MTKSFLSCLPLEKGVAFKGTNHNLKEENSNSSLNNNVQTDIKGCCFKVSRRQQPPKERREQQQTAAAIAMEEASVEKKGSGSGSSSKEGTNLLGPPTYYLFVPCVLVN